MSEIQDLIDAAAVDDAVTLRPGEYQGPLFIRKQLSLDAGGATLWARQGPVLVVECENVVLRNLRVEVTAADEDGEPELRIALRVAAARITLDRVVVRGLVEGLPGEGNQWFYPDRLSIGEIAARRASQLLVRLEVPVPCQLSTGLTGLTLAPPSLAPGLNDVVLTFRDIPADALLAGNIELRSAFLTRLISLSGRASASTSDPHGSAGPTLLWEPSAGPTRARTSTGAAPAPVQSSVPPPIPPLGPVVTPVPVAVPPLAASSTQSSRYIKVDRPLGAAFGAKAAPKAPAPGTNAGAETSGAEQSATPASADPAPTPAGKDKRSGSSLLSPLFAAQREPSDPQKKPK